MNYSFTLTWVILFTNTFTCTWVNYHYSNSTCTWVGIFSTLYTPGKQCEPELELNNVSFPALVWTKLLHIKILRFVVPFKCQWLWNRLFNPIDAVNIQSYTVSLSENLLLTSNVYPECITVVCVVDWVSSASSAPVLTSIRETNWADGVDVGDGLLLRVLCVFGPVKRPSSRLMEFTVQSHCVSCQYSSFMVWGDCRFDFYCWWRTKFSW